MKKATKIITTIMACLFLGVTLHAQEDEVPDYGQLRTNTWSIYGQAGASWGIKVPYEGVSQSPGTGTAPLFGGGINYNIRPWVRLGLNYSWSWLSREQRYGTIQDMKYPGSRSEYTDIPWTSEKGGLAYSDYRMYHHDLDLTAEFNLAEIWPKRDARWFNLYLGTGVGYMFGSGRVYDISMGFAEYEDPDNMQNGLQVSDNWSYGSWYSSKNHDFDANGLYIPAVLNVEFDVHPSWTIGLKGQYDFLINRADMAPAGIASAALTIRFNFAGHKHGYKARYERMKAKGKETEKRLQDDLNALGAALKAQCDECNDNLKKSNEENDALRSRNAELEAKLARMVRDGMIVYFDNNKYAVKEEFRPRLAEIAEVILAHPDAEVDIVGEASAVGGKEHNQKLSEQRVAAVVHVLQEYGVTYAQITSTKAIGDSAGISSAEGRRVTITVTEE
ncbi:MAG: OmpA family protein [Bacteroidales bacterium]|nr:OmpA family protein [Bacteroidales bacterium]